MHSQNSKRMRCAKLRTTLPLVELGCLVLAHARPPAFDARVLLLLDLVGERLPDRCTLLVLPAGDSLCSGRSGVQDGCRLATPDAGERDLRSWEGHGPADAGSLAGVGRGPRPECLPEGWLHGSAQASACRVMLPTGSEGVLTRERKTQQCTLAMRTTSHIAMRKAVHIAVDKSPTVLSSKHLPDL